MGLASHAQRKTMKDVTRKLQQTMNSLSLSPPGPAHVTVGLACQIPSLALPDMQNLLAGLNPMLEDKKQFHLVPYSYRAHASSATAVFGLTESVMLVNASI